MSPSFAEGIRHTFGGNRLAVGDHDFIGLEDVEPEGIELVTLANNVPDFPLGKFRYLADKTGYKYSTNIRPFETVRSLAKVRDLLAHGRVETFDMKTSAKRAGLVALTPKLREWGQISFAQMAVSDIQSLSNGLMVAAKAKFGEWTAGYRSSAFVGIQSISKIRYRDA